MSLPTTPEGWAIHLTQLLDHVRKAHGLARFPIDVASIAMDYSRQVFPDAPITMVEGVELSKGLEGMLMPNPHGNGEWGILYNTNIASPGRRNFTLAHELGHYLLHREIRPQGLECTSQHMGNWRSEQGQIEAEANRFASFLLMPLNDFREQISGQNIDIDLMQRLAERYAVSLTAAILKWLTITDQRAMLVVGKEGFIDWAWSSDPLLKSGIYYAARQMVTELPAQSLAAQNVDREIARSGVQHSAGVWQGQEPVQEMTIYGRQNEMTISLLLYPRHARSGWAGAEIEEEPVSDTYDRFVSKG